MLTDTFLSELTRLNYAGAAKWLFSMGQIDLYDFLADTGADPWGQPGADTRAGLIGFAFAHIQKNGPCILLDWIDETDFRGV
ncbi:hypothetical protein UFOVP70_15 [uncultured Caudovirales phage]|uniref:Uncharacterized protein n=1 Tax=uncultured Caudovirales phage TaxID=2100421 RepID=A0A6J5KW51_9CAUD|nr:hypothetical protein UFOVP70_15 [uncultured Caudovirales phage]